MSEVHAEIVTVSSYDQLVKLALDCLWTRKTLMIHGDPGVGKSAFLQYLASLLGIRKERLFDLRLNTKESPDVSGLSYPDKESQKTLNFPPEFFPYGSEPAILALEELSTALPHVQTTAYEITHDRRSGKWVAHDNTLIMGFGNLNNIGAYVVPMPGPLANRLRHVKLHIDWAGMRDYATRNWHPLVVSYLDLKPTELYKYTKGAYAFQTNRSWEDVSDICNLPHYSALLEKEYHVHGIVKQYRDNSAFNLPNLKYTLDDMFVSIAGSIGEPGSKEFETFLQVILRYKEPVKALLNGDDQTLQSLIEDIRNDSIGSTYAVAFVLGEQLREKVSEKGLLAVCKLTTALSDERESLVTFFMRVNEQSDKMFIRQIHGLVTKHPEAREVLDLLSNTADYIAAVAA